jgi:class 3 adenylate cyclase/predicted ATPase
VTCPSCGASAPAGARFCPSCGHPLLARGDERRVVTVLFADLVGFTGLAETRDPEQVKNLVDGCFELLVADIVAFGGRVDKIVGDAIVALFGAPVAHEDDAERAVRAALRMQRTLGRHAAAIAADVQMRIGVNTGEVLVGAMRAGGDYTAMGDVVNTAARLQQVAAPGSVVVGPATHAATQRVVRYDPIGLLTPRGREAAVEAWTAVEVLAPPGYRVRSRAPLVGRDVELGLVSAAVASSVARSRAHLVLLLGEAGLGKSRLAEEVAGSAERDHGALVLEGRCVPYGEANVWWPLAEAVRQACDLDVTDGAARAAERCAATVAAALGTGAEPAEVTRVAAGLLHLMGYEGSLRDIEPQRARDEVARSTQALLDGLTASSPVVLVLSDVHWADELVLDLVDRLLEHLRRRRLVVVATARPGIEGRWGVRRGGHDVVVVHLDPLSRDAADRLLTELAGDELPRQLRAALLDRSGGNPFFLEELVALLGEAGVVGDGGPVTAPVRQLPDTLRGLVAARLDALTADERVVLDHAAVLGARGPVEALVIMGRHLGDERVATALDGLADKEVLVVQDGRWSFRSDLVREVAYQTLTKGDRARLHFGVADWLERHLDELGDDDSTVSRIAHHYGSAARLAAEVGSVEGVPADLVRRALDWVERAACRAEASDVAVVADRFFDLAVDLAPALPADDATLVRLLLGRARARATLRELDAARADVERARATAEAAGDRAGLASALTVLGDVQQKAGDLDAAVATLDAALTLAREAGDRPTEVEALRLRGVADLFRGDTLAAAPVLEDALRGFCDLRDRRGEAWALQNLAWIAFTEGRMDAAEERLDQSVATFTEIGDVGGLGWAFGLQGWVKFQQGDLAAARQLCHRVTREAETTGDRWGHGMMIVLSALVDLWCGKTDDAVRTARHAVEIFERIDDRYGRVQSLAALARALLAAGRVPEGLAVTDELEAIAAQPGVAGTNAGDFAALAVAQAAMVVGDPERTLAALPARLLAVSSERVAPVADGLVAAGLARLMLGLADEALATLALPHDADPTDANATASLALARAVTGGDGHGDARRLAAELTDTGRGTYLDRMLAHLAAAFAAGREGDDEAAIRAADAAVATVDGTEDRLAHAVARLGRSKVLALIGDPTADRAAGDAAARLEALGLSGTAWEVAFGLARAAGAAA